jgi:DNA primase
MNREAIEMLRMALVMLVPLLMELGLADGMSHQPNGVFIRCPWHNERTPSCSITIRGGVICVRCFGCEVTGDVFTLIAKAYDLDLRVDFVRVIERAHELATKLASATTNAPSDLVDPAATTLVSAGLLEHGPLRACKDVCEHLRARRLLDAAMAEGWGALPFPNHAVVNAVVTKVGADAWCASGLSREGQLTFPLHRLLIPWRNEHGEVSTIQRRTLEQDDRKYVFPRGRGPENPYGIERVGSEGDVALVEGAVDVLSYRELCRRNGLTRTALGLPGAAGWRPEWVKYFRGRVVYLALDADHVGDAAAERLAVALHAGGASRVTRHRPRVGKDWADVLLRGRS